MSVFPPLLPQRQWFVVFGPALPPGAANRPGWAMHLAAMAVRLLPPHFQHCWAFTGSLLGWQVVNPGMDGMTVGEVAGDNPVIAALLRKPDARRRVLVATESRPGRLRLGWPATCASQIAGLLGANGFRGFLPVQLYRHLLHHGQAKVLHHGIW